LITNDVKRVVDFYEAVTGLPPNMVHGRVCRAGDSLKPSAIAEQDGQPAV